MTLLRYYLKIVFIFVSYHHLLASDLIEKDDQTKLEQLSHFEAQPNDMILKIFSDLRQEDDTHALLTTSKRFYRLKQDVWRNVCKSFLPDNYSSEGLFDYFELYKESFVKVVSIINLSKNRVQIEFLCPKSRGIYIFESGENIFVRKRNLEFKDWNNKNIEYVCVQKTGEYEQKQYWRPGEPCSSEDKVLYLTRGRFHFEDYEDKDNRLKSFLLKKTSLITVCIKRFM